MIVDIHTHLGKWSYADNQTGAADLAAEMERLGIRYSIVSSALAVIYDFRAGNAELAEILARYPQLFGYVTVNLNYLDQSLAELETYLRPAGLADEQGRPARFVGVKVHQNMSRHRFDTPEGMALAQAVARYRVPILIHTFGSAIESPWNVVPAAKACPEVPFILAHMGGDAWWEGARAARQADNLYCEICSTWTDPEKTRAAITAVGPQRVLFGTDATLFTAAYTLGALDDAGLTAYERTLVMGENARRLFHLPD